MVVEWIEWKNSELETVSVQKIESDIMNQVRDWLARITPRQPPRNEIGSVRPNITVTFYCFKDHERKTIAEIFEVYRFKDSKSTVELLSESEIKELKRIVEKQ